MKKIEAVIRPIKVGDVLAALNKAGHPGVMVTEIEGHGKQKGIKQEFRGKTYETELLTKAKIEIVANDMDVEKIVQTIREAALTGRVGDGKIFVYPIDSVVRIRTAEYGDIAV
ncbi:MAG: P-II family nitrogen regulator [Candidatus Omnitrophota bacterium]|jgi:nitrogen regulatory protein P-II 1